MRECDVCVIMIVVRCKPARKTLEGDSASVLLLTAGGAPLALCLLGFKLVWGGDIVQIV